MNGLADLRLRFDVLTKTKQPKLHRYWTTRDRAANLRLFRLVAEILHAIDVSAFHPVVGWHCQTYPYQSRCWVWSEPRCRGLATDGNVVTPPRSSFLSSRLKKIQNKPVEMR